MVLRSDMGDNFNLSAVDLKEVIGTADFSTVDKSVWLQKQVAVKKYRKFNYEWVRNRYAQLLRVNHKNILKFYGTAVCPAKELYLVMEYADCGSLATRIYGSDVPSYSTGDALKWMLQCAEGLAFLHGLTPKPIFHGNLKPENLLLFDNCRCLKIGEVASRDYAESKHYIPPIEGAYTDKTDVYSFGIVLWEVLSRRKPFCENQLLAFPLMQFIFGASQPPLSCVSGGLGSANLKSLITRCWVSDQNKRPIVKTVLLNLSIIIRLYFGNIPPLETHASDHIGDVQLEEVIGRGAFGAVHKAKMYGIQLALKRIYVNDSDAKKGIEREVKYLSSAYHENIIKFFCTMEDKERNTLILMEFADCGSLHNYMYRDKKQERNYTYVAALNWMHQLAKGVAYLHAMKPKPVIHRDLKPHNLLLANNFRTLKIADFGAVTEQATLMTTSIGTPGYMSPEIINSKKYTEKSDVYSFGIVFWEVMAHKSPFYHLENNEPVAKLLQASKGKHPPLKDVENCQNADKLKKILKSCWNILPKSRPTMDILKEKLNKLYLQSYVTK